ncbi:MAG: SDR family NAD(P)-dependent oxidoreductase [Candidatus Eremiobacteraeota bacterium]|nr:SDR family NAD(P)-dependent oxidoreductase [Candidatus Eremiobacteraeota bacterium]
MRTILITGASSGIGRALAIRAASAGMNVFAVGRDAQRLAGLAAVVAVHTLVADITEPGAPKRIVGQALAALGGLDALVNNAGAVSAGPLVAQTDATLRRQFETHVVAPLALVREALPALQAAQGVVVMVGSGVARIPVDGLGAYPAAKAALRSATTSLRRELRAYGIAVTYVDPGVVDTPFMERAGMAGGPKPLRVSPEVVARKIFDALAKRSREVNAVPWQTTAVALGERFPRLTDLVLSRSSKLVGSQRTARVAETEPVETPPEPETPPHSLEAALEPHARRMERSGLRPAFVRDLLVPGARLDAGEVAMRWAGMPNKHERALTLDVLQALEAAGYLERAGDDAWLVSEKVSSTS